MADSPQGPESANSADIETTPTADDPVAPRKVYESHLLPDRRKRGASPLVIIIAVVAIGAGAYYYVVAKKPRTVSTAGSIAIAATLPGQNPRIWLRNAAGALTPVTPESDSADSPAFSADGNEIAYIETKNNVRQVFVMDGDGRNQTAVTTGGSSKSSPQFFPSDRSQLGYLSGGILFTTRTDTGVADRILPPFQQQKPGQNPDADAGQTEESTKQPTIIQYAFAPGSDKEHQPAAAVEDMNAVESVAFLPTVDSDAIVAKSDDPNALPIFSSAVTTLSWTNDGKKVLAAGVGQMGPNGTRVTTIVPFDSSGNTAGSPIVLPTPGIQGLESPACSPDGLLIAAALWNEQDPANRKCIGMVVMPSDGSQAPRGLVKGDAEDLRFSPDGGFVYFRRLRADGGHDLYRVDINGSQAVKISDGVEDVTGFAVSPQLQPSGQH